MPMKNGWQNEYIANTEIKELAARLDQNDYDTCVEEIERLAKNKDWSIRQELAIILNDHINDHSIEILKKLACDHSYIVQVEAIDTLQSIADPDVEKIIRQCMNSFHPLVRGYAYRYLCFNCDDEKELIKEFNTIEEKNTWARIFLYIGMAQIGDSDKLLKLTRMYRRCYYLNQCAIVNGLADIYSDLSKANRTVVKQFVVLHYVEERPQSVDYAFNQLARKCRMQKK